MQPDDISQDPAAPRRRGSGVRVVYQQLRDEILDLQMPPGSPVDEAQLAERFGMSRTPIREALIRLTGEGLVENLPNRSTIVSNIDLPNLHCFFDAFTLMHRVTARQAAQNHHPSELALIGQHQASFRAAVSAQDALAMIATNRDFHAAIAEAGHNPYFTGLFLRLLDEGRRLLRLYYQSFDNQLPRQYADEHDQIIAAIAARDIEACDRLGRLHADQIVQQIQQFFACDQRQHPAL